MCPLTPSRAGTELDICKIRARPPVSGILVGKSQSIPAGEKYGKFITKKNPPVFFIRTFLRKNRILYNKVPKTQDLSTTN